MFFISKLEHDDAATKFHTGFANFSSLLAMFDYFKPKLQQKHWRRGQKSSETLFLQYHEIEASKPGRKRSYLEELVMVLMRLKVGLFVSGLADRSMKFL